MTSCRMNSGLKPTIVGLCLQDARAQVDLVYGFAVTQVVSSQTIQSHLSPASSSPSVLPTQRRGLVRLDDF